MITKGGSEFRRIGLILQVNNHHNTGSHRTHREQAANPGGATKPPTGSRRRNEKQAPDRGDATDHHTGTRRTNQSGS
jgi:hypothetical protein